MCSEFDDDAVQLLLQLMVREIDVVFRKHTDGLHGVACVLYTKPERLSGKAWDEAGHGSTAGAALHDAWRLFVNRKAKPRQREEFEQEDTAAAGDPPGPATETPVCVRERAILLTSN